MIKKLYLNSLEKSIKKNQPQYSDTKMEEIMYGLEAIYVLITKTIILLIIAYFLGIFKEVVLFVTFYAVIRCVAFGVHASNGTICLILGSILFISFSILSAFMIVPLWLKILVVISSFISFLKFAPADTEKRPLINRSKREKYKKLTLLLWLVYTLCLFYFNETFISNVLLFAMFLEAIMVLPITYKIFNQKYENYKSYK